MSDELNLNSTPELTFEPSAAQAVAAPELTLEPSVPPAPQVDEAAQASREANAVKLDESMLSEAEKKMVEDFSQKIDVTDSNLVLNYGAAAQKNIAAFSESALSNVKTKDLGEVGEALSSLVVELKTFGEPEKKGIGGFFQKKKNELEAMKASYAKAEVNVEKITSKEYAKELAAKIDMGKAQEYTPTEGIEAKAYNGCTSNFTVMDKHGNVLSQTQTIRNWWGGGVVIPGRGFIMNNTMADFSPKVGVRTTQGLAYGMANAVRPGKTPLSSMSPTIVMKDGKPLLSVGAAGGPRIITSSLQLIINSIDYGMMMDSAVRHPHMCCLTLDQGLELEEGFSPDTVKLLEQKGHTIKSTGDFGVLLVLPNGIRNENGTFLPGGTSRVDGGGGVLTEDGTIAIDGLCFL